MAEYPAKLVEMVDLFSLLEDRAQRVEMLIDIADEFKEVPGDVATRPFPETNRIPQCESEGFVWAVDRPDNTLKFYFAVENPQGISAMAAAVILDRTLSGAPLEQVVKVPQDIVNYFFGNELTMGKSLGLQSMVAMVQREARKRLELGGAAPDGP